MAKTATTETVTTTPAEAPVENKNKLLHLRVSKPHGCREDSILVGHNGKFWQVKYDTDVYVPEVVLYTIKQKLRAEKIRDYKISML